MIRGVDSVVKNIVNQIKKDVSRSMKKDVLEAVKDVHADAIEKTVYSQYSPEYYKRRREDDGLKDRRNMRGNKKGSMGLRFTNIARSNSRYGGDKRFRIAESIEYGTGIMATIGRRRFFHETYTRLKRGKSHINALKSSLRGKGYIIHDKKVR